MARRPRTRPLVLAALALLVAALVGAFMYREDLIQTVNAQALVDAGLDGRLACHRVNRPAKLDALLRLGLRSFEVDLLVRDKGAEVYFEVGHDAKDARGLTFDELLERTRSSDVKKIWLDVKNLNDDNIDAALRELERLDTAFDLKEIVIVETSAQSAALARLSLAGFHTSYYLPTGRIKKLLADADTAGMRSEAARIAEQTRQQQIAAVSFDSALYPFVKQHLEPTIDARVVYHTWYSIQLWRWGAVERLRDKPYFGDERMRTILYSCKTTGG